MNLSLELDNGGDKPLVLAKGSRSIDLWNRLNPIVDQLLRQRYQPAKRGDRKAHRPNELSTASMRRWTSLSELEKTVALFLIAIAASPRTAWVRLVKTFLARTGWRMPVPGRPRLSVPNKDSCRGRRIDEIKRKLQQAFALKQQSTRAGGNAAGEDVIGPKLEQLGYSAAERRAVLKEKSLESAACHCYWENCEKEKDLRTIKNSRSRYLRTYH